MVEKKRIIFQALFAEMNDFRRKNLFSILTKRKMISKKVVYDTISKCKGVNNQNKSLQQTEYNNLKGVAIDPTCI